jgi:hypothetical protein
MKAVNFSNAFHNPRNIVYFHNVVNKKTTMVFLDGEGQEHLLRTFNVRRSYNKPAYYRLTEQEVVDMILPRII